MNRRAMVGRYFRIQARRDIFCGLTLEAATPKSSDNRGRTVRETALGSNPSFNSQCAAIHDPINDQIKSFSIWVREEGD